jgi:2'-5' RNA ligase
MSEKYFLLIEILDGDLVYLLKTLREIFSMGKKKSSVHITIKGPQKTLFKVKSANKFLSERYPLRIRGVGIFHNNDIYIVYLKVILDELKKYKMWYKPDYPDEFNPHITLYEGKNEKLAKSIYALLEKQNIDLCTTDYSIIPYVSKQPDLLSLPNDDAKEGLSTLVELGMVHADIFDRARDLMKDCDL